MTGIFRDIRIVEATIATDTNVYADHDQIGTVVTLSDVFDGTSKQGEIFSISLLDKASQKSNLKVHFFDESPTVTSSDNAPLDISDAEMADKWLGFIGVFASSYDDLANSAVFSTTAGLGVSSKGKDLYLLVESAGTPTYTGATDLVLKLGIIRG